MMPRLQHLIPALLVAAAACSQSSAPASFAELGGGAPVDVPFDIGGVDRVQAPETWDFSIADPDLFNVDTFDASDLGGDSGGVDGVADLEPDLAVIPDGNSDYLTDSLASDSADAGPDAMMDPDETSISDLGDDAFWDVDDLYYLDNMETETGEVWLCEGTPGAEELCDGLDNDCDGETDEEVPGESCWLDNEFGSCPGTTACLEGETVCVGFPAEPEQCDGMDNDCNGETDEGFGQTTCGLGVCLHTVDNCLGGIAQVCEPMEGVDLEICNGLDDDCDGSVDEGENWGECAVENEFGSCTGISVCKSGSLLCKAVPPAEEVCDGSDNNCDGQVDEGLAGQACLVENEFGACPGLAQCDNGVAGCVGPSPQPEICDGIDNDCNGEVDDGAGGEPCASENDFGACPGTLVCEEGSLQCDAPVPGPESCDGVDNNCDGVVDEGTGGELCVVENEFGVCEGSLVCENGFPVCDAPEAAPELCDGIDNDCNGETDDSLGVTECGLGICKHAVDNCLGGAVQVCEPMEGAGVEICDGKDNDCDGAIDEGLGSTECGLGECNHIVLNCVDGIPQDCDALEGSAPEECDGLDNDCDGEVDQGLGTTACGLGICLHIVDNCVGGIPQVCDAFEGVELEECDGKDNDCDGVTDEGFDDNDLDGVADCVDTDDDNDGDPDETDCGPLDPDVFNGQEEACYNGVDDDCDETTADQCILADCQAVIDAAPNAPDGQYDIAPDGDGGVPPFAVKCEMDGGSGWIALSISDSDGVVVGEYSTYNPWHKCADDGSAHFHWLADEAAISVDYSPATTFIQDVPLGYRNPGTGTLYSAAQMAAMRSVVTELSPTTRMVAITGDDDYGNYQAGAGYGHEVYVMGSSGEWKLLTPGTNGECGGGTIWPHFGSKSAFYLWATDADECETDGLTGLGGPNMGALPVGDILPFKVRLVVQTGGGVAFGWEEKEFLVR